MDSKRLYEWTVLVVDDFCLHREIARFFLTNMPDVKKVYTAKTASEMVRLIKNNPEINCLLLDVDLGDDSLNGIQTYNLLKDEGYDIPAILITDDHVDAHESYQIGIVDVVSKKYLYDFDRIKRAFHSLHNYVDYKRFVNNHGRFVPAYHEYIQMWLAQDIISIEATKSGIEIFTTERDEPIPTTISFKSYELWLEGSAFLKVSRHQLVNTDHIVNLGEDQTITLTNGKTLKVSSHHFLTIQTLRKDRAKPKPKSGMITQMIMDGAAARTRLKKGTKRFER